MRLTIDFQQATAITPKASAKDRGVIPRYEPQLRRLVEPLSIALNNGCRVYYAHDVEPEVLDTEARWHPYGPD
jgi:hypothetical protein